MSEEKMYKLKDFYNYLTNSNNNIGFNSKKQRCYCLNTKEAYGFSKNFFIDNFKDFSKYIVNNKNKDCYINYFPLKYKINRKNDNVYGVTLIALDIEMKNKQVPESDKNKLYMKKLIYGFLKEKRIRDFMIIDSGNGYHLYMRVDMKKITKLETVKIAYSNIIKSLSDEINEFIKLQLVISKRFDINTFDNYKISIDDRKDLAGILRVPFTVNTKIPKQVEIIDIQYGFNDYIESLYKHHLIKTSKMLSSAKNIRNELYCNLEGLPKTIEELAQSPLVRIRMDRSLKPPKIHGDWHKCIVFAIQSIVYHSGLYKDPQIKELNRQYNIKCNTNVNLDACSYTSDIEYPISLALKFCKDNGYDKYYDEIKKLYLDEK